MKHLSDYIISLKEKGDFYFTSQKALKFMDVSDDAFRMSLARLRQNRYSK